MCNYRFGLVTFLSHQFGYKRWQTDTIWKHHAATMLFVPGGETWMSSLKSQCVWLFNFFVCCLLSFFVDFRACKPGLCVFRFSSTLPEPSVYNFHKNWQDLQKVHCFCDHGWNHIVIIGQTQLFSFDRLYPACEQTYRNCLCLKAWIF